MKVIHVETGRHLYGGALQVLYLMRGLKEKGIENILVCPMGSEIEKEASLADTICPVPMRGEFDIFFVWRLLRIIRRERPDIVHLHSRRGADIMGGISAKLSGVKSVLTRRVDNPETRLMANFKYKLYDRIIAISCGIRNVLVSEGVPAAKVECIHDAVDSASFSDKCDRGWFEKEFDIPEGFRALGMVAQFIERKGHRHLLKALPAILKEFKETYVVLFGKGPLEKTLRDMCKGLEKNVGFAGFRDDLENILPCLDMLVHPAEMEGLGVSILQASASGIPVVATKVGGIPEIIRDGVNGLLIPPGEPEAIAGAIVRLLKEPETAKAMGARGKEIVRKEFSIKAMVEGNLKVYEEVLYGGKTL